MIVDLSTNVGLLDRVVEVALEMQQLVAGRTNAEDVRSSLISVVHQGVVYVNVQDQRVTGFIAGVVVHNILADCRILQEVAWYDNSKQGGRLLLRFKQAAKEMGCTCAMLSVLETAGEPVHSGLKRIGFEQVERVYRLDV